MNKGILVSLQRLLSLHSMIGSSQKIYLFPYVGNVTHSRLHSACCLEIRCESFPAQRRNTFEVWFGSCVTSNAGPYGDT
jgi:hypothetical protein